MTNIIKNPQPLLYLCNDCKEYFLNKEKTNKHKCCKKCGNPITKDHDCWITD